MYESLGLDLKLIGAPTPKIHSLDIIIKAFIIKEFEGLSLRAAENRIIELLGIRIDHSVLHFWEKKLFLTIEEIINRVLEKLYLIDYSVSFVDFTVFTNKKEKARNYMQ
jgi:hypothetical protein